MVAPRVIVVLPKINLKKYRRLSKRKIVKKFWRNDEFRRKLFGDKNKIDKKEYSQFVSEKIEQKFGIEIPYPVCNQLFKRAGKLGILKYNELIIEKTNKFEEYKKEISDETRQKEHKNIEKLLERFNQFYLENNGKKEKIIKKDFEEVIKSFLSKNDEKILFSKESGFEFDKNKNSKKYSFSSFFDFLNKNKNEENDKHLETIFNINFGNIISKILISDIEKSLLKNLNIYIDTPYCFRSIGAYNRRI